MRFLSTKLVLLAAVLVSACDFWPRDLEPLAESVSRQVSGEATAWLLGGDVVVIDVTNSPLYRAVQPELEAQATAIAEQAIAFIEAPLESIACWKKQSSALRMPGTRRRWTRPAWSF